MANKIKKILVFLILGLSFLSKELIAQSIEINQFDQNKADDIYWFLEKNNFGQSSFNKNLKVNYSFKRNGLEILLNIISPYKEYKNIFNNDFEIISRELGQNNFFGESYIKYDLEKNSYVKIGKYYRDFSSYMNDALSSGSLLISNNAQPMPKIGFVQNIDLKNPIFSFKYGIAHGIFDKNEYYITSPYLHEKFIYLIVQKKNNIFKIGLVHEAMWGGKSTEYTFPTGFNNFLKVMVSADGPADNSSGDHINAIGNHLGIWDFYFEKKLLDRKYKFYYQHFFEDTSSFRFANKIDGLWGFEYKNSSNSFMLEYLDFSNSSIDPPYQDDGYYTHYEYKNGWRYKGNILGNPYINTNNSITYYKFLILGISGQNRHFDYLLKSSKNISNDDNILFKISISKEIFQKNRLSLIFANNGEKISYGLSYFVDI